MQLQIRHGTVTHKVSVDDVVSGQTVQSVQQLLETQLDIPAHKQKLILKGKVLAPETALASTGIKDGCTLMLLATGTESQVLIAPRQHCCMPLINSLLSSGMAAAWLNLSTMLERQHSRKRTYAYVTRSATTAGSSSGKESSRS
jgi:Ubiquitin family